MRGDIYFYFVEGETEGHLIKTLKREYLPSGKIHKFRLTENMISDVFIKTIKPSTNIIIVFDTDVNDEKLVIKLRDNIKTLKKYKNVKDIILIPQIENLEDELLFSTCIKDIKEFVPSKSSSDFKSDFLSLKDLEKKLVEREFDIDKFWSRKADNRFKEFKNYSYKIKNICKVTG